MPADPMPGHLRSGYHRFRVQRYPGEHERYRRLAAEGQHPPTAIIACADSRAAPEMVFDAAPGELFVVRNVAALVPVYAPDSRPHAASAALEYAVLALGVRHLVVMGHGRCGGVAAALDDRSPLTVTDFVGSWVAPLRDLAMELDPTDWADPVLMQRDLEFRSIEQSVLNLQTFPWIRSRVRAGTLEIGGCWFDISHGQLWVLGPDGWEQVPDS